MYTSFEFDSSRNSVPLCSRWSVRTPRIMAGCCGKRATYHRHLAQRVLDGRARVPFFVQLLEQVRAASDLVPAHPRTTCP